MRLTLLFGLALAASIVASGAWMLMRHGESPGSGTPGTARSEDSRSVPVELRPVALAPIARRRTFTGTLEPFAEQVVAPKIAGRIEEIAVDLADRVERGQVVARLDNDEHVQAVAQAEADLAVAQANLAEAQSLLTIADRELDRVGKLSDRGVSSASQLDIARADQLAKQAQVAVSTAQVTRAQAALATARIRLSYTEVTADWRGGNDERVVAERFVEEGETVSANEQLFRIVELDPITAVITVAERDYGLLADGLGAELRTDAFPGAVFEGRIARIAPVFRETTRQARVELTVDNPRLMLKPGMFVRASVVLEQVADAVVVPDAALTLRDGREGLFVLAEDDGHVEWRPVDVGIRDDGRAQIIDGDDLAGRQVVTLGQQLLDDGSPVLVPQPDSTVADASATPDDKQTDQASR